MLYKLISIGALLASSRTGIMDLVRWVENNQDTNPVVFPQNQCGLMICKDDGICAEYPEALRQIENKWYTTNPPVIWSDISNTQKRLCALKNDTVPVYPPKKKKKHGPGG